MRAPRWRVWISREFVTADINSCMTGGADFGQSHMRYRQVPVSGAAHDRTARDSFMTAADGLEGRFAEFRSNVRACMVVRVRRPTISAKVITELLRLGYLQPAKRHKPHIVERALARLRADLVRDGVVFSSTPGDRASTAPEDGQQPSAMPRPTAST
jgi:hypothetical protein